jgi:ATP-dependent Clp protease ATP-binding subunit ClpA
LRLDEVVERFKCRNVTIQADLARLSEYIAENLQDKLNGARGVERSIEQLLIEPIAKVLLWNEDQGVATVLIEDNFYQNGKIVLQ